jgi:hypothetical protein
LGIELAIGDRVAGVDNVEEAGFWQATWRDANAKQVVP